MEDEILSRNPLGEWKAFPVATKPAGVHPHDGGGFVDGQPAGTVRGRLGGRHGVFVQCSPETRQERGPLYLFTNNGEDFVRFAQFITLVPLEDDPPMES